MRRNKPQHPLTLEQLQAAWRRRKTHRWPATYDQAMEHPIYSRVVTIEALRAELKIVMQLTEQSADVASKPKLTGFWMDSDKDD